MSVNKFIKNIIYMEDCRLTYKYNSLATLKWLQLHPSILNKKPVHENV